MRNLALGLITCLIIFLVPATALNSSAQKFPQAQIQGSGSLPYNYRIIDQHIHAGGHPLNPQTNFGNSDQQVMAILKHLKDQGVLVIIDLENTQRIQSRYTKLLKEAGIKRIHLPMSLSQVPTKQEWLIIKTAMQKPVYIHCKWGADRTGAVIGRYLVEVKGYTPKQSWEAVKTGGSQAGTLGGLKNYPKLRDFFGDYSTK